MCRRGIDSGSHSTPAAALTLGALGVAGLVEWPVLLAVGGGALLLRRLNNSHARRLQRSRRHAGEGGSRQVDASSAERRARRRPSGHRQRQPAEPQSRAGR